MPEAAVRQAVRSPDLGPPGQEVRGPSFQAEESAEHQDVAVAALLPQGSLRKAKAPATPPRAQVCVCVCARTVRDSHTDCAAFAETRPSALRGCDRVVRLPAHSVRRLHLLRPGKCAHTQVAL